MKYIIPLIMLIITLSVTVSFYTRQYKPAGIRYNGDVWWNAKIYVAKVEYCDGRLPDTAFFWYVEPPSSDDILFQDHDVMYRNYDLPVIHNMIGMTQPGVKQFINPCRVTNLTVNDYNKERFDSIYKQEYALLNR